MNRKVQKAIYVVFCALVYLFIVKCVTNFADDIMCFLYLMHACLSPRKVRELAKYVACIVKVNLRH